jgi:hypothetical protein
LNKRHVVVVKVKPKSVSGQDGQLTIPTNTVVPRDLLEPLDRNALTVGTVEELDSFLTRFPKPRGNCRVEAESGSAAGSAAATWLAYRQYCDRLAQAVFPTLAFAQCGGVPSGMWLELKRA